MSSLTPQTLVTRTASPTRTTLSPLLGTQASSAPGVIPSPTPAPNTQPPVSVRSPVVTATSPPAVPEFAQESSSQQFQPSVQPSQQFQQTVQPSQQFQQTVQPSQQFQQPSQQFQPSVTFGGAQSSNQVVVPTPNRKGIPKWDQNVKDKFMAKHAYNQITLNETGTAFKATTLQVSGVPARLKDKHERGIDFWYLPDLRLAGTASDLRNYLTQIIQLGDINNNTAVEAVKSAYTFTNYIGNPRLDNELRAKSLAPKPAKAAASQMTLDQFIEIHNVTKGAGLRSIKVSQSGKSSGSGRTRKSDVDKIREAAANNNSLLSNRKANPQIGGDYKYLNYSIGQKDGAERSSLRAPGAKSFKILMLKWPISSTNSQLLANKLSEFGNNGFISVDLYNEGIQELRNQGAAF